MISSSNGDTTPSPATDTSSRASSFRIDMFRFPLIIPIIMVHSVGLVEDQVTVVGIISNLGRFIIPFYLMASGYLVGRYNPPTVKGIIGTGVKLLPVFLFWLIAYIAIFSNITNLKHPGVLAAALMRGEPAFHLWFLPALGLSTVMVLVLRHLGMKTMMGIGVILYLFTLATAPYKKLLGIPDSAAMLYHHFGAFIFVAAGYCLANTKKTIGLLPALTLFIVGGTLHMSEAYFLMSSGYGPFQPHAYLLGTPLFGIGAFLLATHAKPFKGSKRLTRLGRYTLGVYCSHPFLIGAVYPFYDRFNLWHVFFVSMFALFGSFGLVAIMMRTPVLKYFVR